MNKTVGDLLKPLKYLLFISIIVVIILLIKSSSTYINAFDITLNGSELGLNSVTTLSNFGIKTEIDKKTYAPDNYIVHDYDNIINLDSKMTLNVQEYEVYNNDKRQSNGNFITWFNSKGLEYKKVSYSKIKLQIKRLNLVLYDGDYISDISDIISSKGRYYFHIYLTRKDSSVKNVTTHISFNVLVGGNSTND